MAHRLVSVEVHGDNAAVVVGDGDDGGCVLPHLQNRMSRIAIRGTMTASSVDTRSGGVVVGAEVVRKRASVDGTQVLEPEVEAHIRYLYSGVQSVAPGLRIPCAARLLVGCLVEAVGSVLRLALHRPVRVVRMKNHRETRVVVHRYRQSVPHDVELRY